MSQAQPSPLPATLSVELAALLGKENLLTNRAQLATFESDGLLGYSATPAAVAIPTSTSQVVELVRLCHHHQIPFVARGSGTSLSGGAMPVAGGIVIALNRLDKILSIDPASRVAVVQPGVTNLAVSRAARTHGLYFAPDPSSGQICTLGGNVAFNAGGAHCLKYGMTSNHLLALEAILADGQLVRWGSASLDEVGPDLPGLFVGSEGMFGIALELTLRLLPVPERFHTVLAAYDTVEQAGDAVSRVVASGLLPGALEIMDRLAMDAANKGVQAGYPEGFEAVLIVELEGPSAEVEAEIPLLSEILSSTGASHQFVAVDEAQRAAIWRGRKSVFSAVGLLSPDFMVQDGVVPRSQLGDTLREIRQISLDSGVPVANVFHAGDGNLHPLIMYDGRIPGALQRAEEVAARILKVCCDRGGSITGEHGVGMEKRDMLAEMFDPPSLAAFRQARLALDPLEIANPGKMFPGGEAPSLALHGLHPLEKAGLISRM